jgi:hypothetical protein
MVYLSSVMLRLVWLLAFAILPGLAFLRWADFQYRNRLDLLLAVFATGIPLAGLCVYLLLLGDAYYVPVAWLIPLLSAAWLLVCYRKTGRVLPAILPAQAGPPKPNAAAGNMLDGAAIFCCGFLLLVDVLDAATSPLHSWDAVVTWDKWATQWALRSGLYHSTQGGYPQLLPMFSSLLYKTSGHPGPLPIEQYALHVFHPLLGLLLLAACVRAAQLFELPAWPVLLTVFGFNTLKDAVSSGGADMLVTWMTFAAPLLFLAWRREEWNARWRGSPILIACLFGAAFSKATGWFAILPVLLAGVWHPAAKRILPKPALAGALALPVLLLAPFYVAQYAASQEPLEHLDAHEVNFRLRPVEMGSGFQDVIHASYSNATGWGRFQAAGKRFLADYSLPSAFADAAPILPALLLMALFVASFWVPPLRAFAIVSAAILAVWYRTASYDLRNLLPALPFLGVCLAAGALQLFAWIGRIHGAAKLGAGFALAGVLGVFTLPVAFGIVAQANAVTEDTLLRGHLEARLGASAAGFPESTRRPFPNEFAAWNYLEGLGFLRSAPHVIAASMLYRWTSAGVYPACDWSRAIVSPGDLFIAAHGAPLPGPYDRWSKLRTFGPLEIYLDDRKPVAVPLQNLILTGTSPPRLTQSSPDELDAEAGGNQSMLVYNLQDRDSRSGFTVVWQATVDAPQPDPALSACSLVYNPAIADPALSATSVDIGPAAGQIVRYSGVLAIRPATLSRNPGDGILFGVCRTGAAQLVRLRAFRYSIYRW